MNAIESWSPSFEPDQMDSLRETCKKGPTNVQRGATFPRVGDAICMDSKHARDNTQEVNKKDMRTYMLVHHVVLAAERVEEGEAAVIHRADMSGDERLLLLCPCTRTPLERGVRLLRRGLRAWCVRDSQVCCVCWCVGTLHWTCVYVLVCVSVAVCASTVQTWVGASGPSSSPPAPVSSSSALLASSAATCMHGTYGVGKFGV